MDFSDTPEEAEFRAEARSWLDANAKPLASSDAKGGRARSQGDVRAAQEWQARKADAGWACITWPKEYGGRGATAIQNVIWNQEEARYDTPPNVFAIGQGMLGPTILAHGTDDQKERFLRKMLRGEEIWCQLFSEPASGSDLAGLRTTARREGEDGDWVLNGQKIWSTGAHFCHWGMVLTRTDPDLAKHRGITYFIVDMKAPGVEVRPIRMISGTSGFNEVFFSDVRVPDDLRVGEVNGGWRAAITTLMNERAAIGGGSGSPTVEELVDLARATDWGGRPALEDSSVRQQLAEFYILQKGVEYTRYRTLTAISRGETPGPEMSIGKLIGARLRQRMASFGCELQGTAGAMSDPSAAVDGGAWQGHYLQSPGLRIAGGTDEILRNIIAERVLSLPPEIRVDKDRPFKEVRSGTVKG